MYWFNVFILVVFLLITIVGFVGFLFKELK